MALERTFSLIKPDGVQRGLVGEILRRFEARGFKIVAVKMLRVPRALAEAYYAEHRGKGLYEALIAYITSGPAVAMVLEGDDAVAVARQMMGATDPKKAGPGTIRGDFGQQIGRNVIHGSDSPQSAKREIDLFFTANELQDYTHIDAAWLFE